MNTQDQINEKMISLVIKGNKITAKLLYKALTKLLAELEKQGKKMVAPKTYKGKQSVKDLLDNAACVCPARLLPVYRSRGCAEDRYPPRRGNSIGIFL